MYVELGVRQLSLRVYEAKGDEAYIASAQILVYGDRGFIYSINGPGFYKAFDLILEACLQNNITSLEGYLGKPHARLLNRILRTSGWEVTTGDKGILDGHELYWYTAKYTAK